MTFAMKVTASNKLKPPRGDETLYIRTCMMTVAVVYIRAATSRSIFEHHIMITNVWLLHHVSCQVNTVH